MIDPVFFHFSGKRNDVLEIAIALMRHGPRELEHQVAINIPKLFGVAFPKALFDQLLKRYHVTSKCGVVLPQAGSASKNGNLVASIAGTFASEPAVSSHAGAGANQERVVF